MARKLVFAPHIPDDLSAAIDHYETVSPSLANQFREHANQRLDDISDRPESFAVDVPPIRFARVERFPYVIFFVPYERFVSILAVVHGSSDPRKWRERH